MILGIFFYLSIPIIILLFDLISKFIIEMIFTHKKIDSFKIGKLLINKDKLHRILTFAFCLLFLTCVCAFRSISVGNDTNAYYIFYNETKTYTYEQAKSAHANYETGFVLYNYIFSSLKAPYYLFSFVSYFIVFLAVVWSSFALSKYPTITICLYVCFTFFVLNLSTIRQSMAFAFCLYALLIFCLIKKHRFLKILMIIPLILAMTMHVSSISFVLVFTIYFIRIKTKSAFLIYIAAITTFVLFFPAISSLMVQWFTTPSRVYSFYPPASAGVDVSGTLMLIIVVALGHLMHQVFDLQLDLSLSKTKINNDNKIMRHFSPLFNDREIDSQLAFAMAMFQAIFIILDNTMFLLARVAAYGSLGFCILLPNLMFSVSKNKPNNIFVLTIALLGALYFFYAVLRINYLNILPYGVF